LTGKFNRFTFASKKLSVIGHGARDVKWIKRKALGKDLLLYLLFARDRLPALYWKDLDIALPSPLLQFRSTVFVFVNYDAE